MRLWKDGADQRLGIAEPDPQGRSCHPDERAIEEPTPVAETITGGIEADDGSHGRIATRHRTELQSLREVFRVTHVS